MQVAIFLRSAENNFLFVCPGVSDIGHDDTNLSKVVGFSGYAGLLPHGILTGFPLNLGVVRIIKRREYSTRLL